LLAAVFQFVPGDDVFHFVKNPMALTFPGEGGPEASGLGAGAAIGITEIAEILFFNAREMSIELVVKIKALGIPEGDPKGGINKLGAMFGGIGHNGFDVRRGIIDKGENWHQQNACKDAAVCQLIDRGKAGRTGGYPGFDDFCQ